MTPLALAGVRVLDLSRLLPGPFASLVLADLGALVDKLEDLEGGDYLRHLPPAHDGESLLFGTLNRNKRSLGLDLKRPAGKAAFCKLIPHYDVLIDPFRPGVLARLGLPYEALRELHPGLIICAITGYGQTGPLRDRAGHDLNYLAQTGVLGLQGPASSAPQVPAVQVADIGGALFACIGILAALRERDRNGNGAVLDISLAESALPFALATFAHAFAPNSAEPHPAPARGAEGLSGGIAPYCTYATKDARFVALAALEPKFWIAFATAVGIEVELGAMLPGPHQAALKQELSAVFAARTLAEWVAFAEQHDVCLEPVLTAQEALAAPWLAARGTFFNAAPGDAASVQLRLPTTPERGHSPAPQRGEHSHAILRDAGFSAEEIAELAATGAIARG